MVLTQKRSLFLILVWAVGAVVAVGAGLLAFRLVGGGGDPGTVPAIAESAEAPLAAEVPAAELPADPGALPEEVVVIAEPVPGGFAPAAAAPAPAPAAAAPAPAPAAPAPAPAPELEPEPEPEPVAPAPVAPAAQEPPAPAPGPVDPSPNPQPTASTDPSVGTFQNNGGTIEVKCHGERPALVKATPKPRWAVERTREELDSLEVRFHSEEDDSRIEVVCENARPVVTRNE